MRRHIQFLLAVIVFALTGAVSRATDLKIEARLIWAADVAEAVKYEAIDPGLAEKLHRSFKWKNYYEITNKAATIPTGQTADLKMSEACTLRIKNLDGTRLEVNCIGKGKQVFKGNHSLKESQWLVLGGPDSGDTAWFIGIRAADKNAPPAKAIGKN